MTLPPHTSITVCMHTINTKQATQFRFFIRHIWENRTVRDTILWYQDMYHTPSMAMLWCMWHDYHHSPMHKKTIIQMTKYAQFYEAKHIIPIRNKRKKTNKNTLIYKNLLQTEIQAEMHLCTRIEKKFPTPISKNCTFHFNVQTFLQITHS